MPINAPYWADFLSCPICFVKFGVNDHLPITLGCGHTYCRECLKNLNNRKCPVDQSLTQADFDELPANLAIIQLVITGENDRNVLTNIKIGFNSNSQRIQNLNNDDKESYERVAQSIANMALYLKCSQTKSISPSILSLSVQRKIVALINCQLLLEEGKERALRAAHSLAERVVNELNLFFQNPQQLSTSLWNAVRSRGCQFLGPAMQEEVLKLVLLALEDGSSLSRKVLVMFVVQRLEPHFPQASKTGIGHVVQLLYRASCFRVSKRNGNSSLMQLKESFCTYNELRREHDSQIVQIAIESGIRIAPEQWSLLLYGDTSHKSHMQSIIRKLQPPSSMFAQSVQELIFALKCNAENSNLNDLYKHLNNLVEVAPSDDSHKPTWRSILKVIEATDSAIKILVEYINGSGSRKTEHKQTLRNSATKFKVSFCHNLSTRGICPRGNACTFAHSVDELEKYRPKGRRQAKFKTKNVSELPQQNYGDYKSSYSISSPNYLKIFSQNFVDNNINTCQDCENSSVTSVGLRKENMLCCSESNPLLDSKFFNNEHHEWQKQDNERYQKYLNLDKSTQLCCQGKLLCDEHIGHKKRMEHIAFVRHDSVLDSDSDNTFKINLEKFNENWTDSNKNN